MRRGTILLSLAALAPVVVFAAMTGAASFRDQYRQSEAAHLAEAREINARLDGELMADLSALSVLASSATIVSKRWPEARQRALGVMKLRRNWRDVVLTDAASRQEIWSAQGEWGAPRPGRAEVLTFLKAPSVQGQIANIGGKTRGCPCFILHQPIFDGSALRFVLTAEVGVGGAKRILDSYVRSPDVGAIVDRQGNFIARTLLHEQRLGRPSSTYVRATLQGAPTGIYEGITLEGLKNRSVYERSPISGFATHIALPREEFKILGTGSMALRLGALILSLVIAVAGIVYALREQRLWKMREQGRVQAQKLEAIGRFASGVTHDFNNLLTVIISCLNRLEKPLADSSSRQFLDHARTAAWQGADLVAQVLKFAREQPPELEPINLGEAVAELAPLLREMLPPTIVLSMEPVVGTTTAISNKALLESALLNLARNAVDAMPDGGVITIEILATREPDVIELCFADTGHGMPPEVLQRALDPFFTTKTAGKGTGLGLAQIQTLMVQSGGEIEIVSKVDKGTTVILRFRRASEALHND